MKYYLIVGEASGDLHASNLMKALMDIDHNADFRYFGGDLMQQVGGTLVKHYRDLAYMGFIPVLIHARTILKNMTLCKQDIMSWNPNVVILVDYPGFNLEIAKYVNRNSKIPIFYYISPKIWAWKEYRIKNIRRDVDELFSILPFEVEFFKKHKYNIHYVGNPCVDAVEDFLLSRNGNESFSQFCESNALECRQIIAILAGSRKQEIKDNLKTMLTAASEFDNEYQFVIAGAQGIDETYYKRFIPYNVHVSIVFDQTYRLLRQSTAALVTSGTATLETAILGIPQVVCYYTFLGKLVALLKSLILKVKYVSLVNLVAGKEIVKELIADKMTVDNVRINLYDILPGGQKRDQMITDYTELRKILGEKGASKRAAKQIYDLLRK